jgi:hypothetical protein
VLASLLLGTFAQSGVVDPARLVHSERSAWANVNGLLVLLTLFLANAQVISRLTPDTGLPALAVSVLFFVTLLQLAAAALDRTHCLRVWGVTLLAAFVVKFIVLGALAGPADRPLARALQALVDGLTFGSLSQPIERPAAGYLAFAMLATYLVGLVLLPAIERRRTGLLRRLSLRAGRFGGRLVEPAPFENCVGLGNVVGCLSIGSLRDFFRLDADRQRVPRRAQVLRAGSGRRFRCGWRRSVRRFDDARTVVVPVFERENEF